MDDIAKMAAANTIHHDHDRLLYVETEVLSNKECNELWGGMTDQLLCAKGAGDGGVCSGDSGNRIGSDWSSHVSQPIRIE